MSETIKQTIREKQQAKRQDELEAERVNNPKRYAARLRAEERSRKNCPIRKFQEAFYVPIQTNLDAINQGLKNIRAEMVKLHRNNNLNGDTDDHTSEIGR